MDGHIGISLGAIAAITAILGAAMAGLGAPWWAWVGFAIWGVLWVIAALGLSDKASRAFLAGTLRKSNFTQIYTTLARRNVMAVWDRLCDPLPEDTTVSGASVPTLFRAALTWRLYDVALRLAVAYPILLLVGQWVATGAEGRVGSFALLAAADFWPHRALVILLVLILTGGAVGAKLASASQRPTFNKVARLLFPLAFLLALSVSAALAVVLQVGVGAIVTAAFVVAFMSAFVPKFAGAGAFLLSVALPISIQGTGIVAVTVASVYAVGVFCAVEALTRRGNPCLGLILLTGAIIGALLIVAMALNWAELRENVRSLLLFLTVLPLINALFDVVSYALTLSLIRRGLRSGLPFLWGLADLGLACGLLLGLGAVLVAVIHGLNVLAGVAFLDLPALFAGVQVEPGAYVWLYLMLFSTLLPTLLHGTLSLLGVQGIWPRALRRPVAGRVDEAPASPLHALGASFSLSLVWTLPLLALVGVLWGIWHYAQPALMAGLQLYLDGLVWIAAAPVGAI